MSETPAPSSFSPEESRWSVADCLTKLADAADHLLRDHDCDAHGWEQVGSARDAARKHAARLSSVQEQTGERTCDCKTLRVRLTELREERLAIAKLFDIEPCYDDTPHSWSCGDRGNVSLLALLASQLPSPETAGMFAQRELRDVLAWHHLTGIECNHEAKTDVATCGCAVWRSEPMPSVGAAVEAWADHVLAALAGLPSPSSVPKDTTDHE